MERGGVRVRLEFRRVNELIHAAELSVGTAADLAAAIMSVRNSLITMLHETLLNLNNIAAPPISGSKQNRDNRH